jgi:parvulin-like peptidyl-prolyl isomerase
MKISRTVAMAGALMAFMLPARAELVNAIQAIVHDAVITYQEVKALNSQTEDVVVRQYRGQPATLEQKLNELQQENLEKLLQRQLILHEFKTAGYNLPDSVIDDLVQDTIRADFGDRATLTKTLEARGITYEKFRQQIRERFIVSQLRAKNISQEIIISPHKIEQYYLAHKEEYKLEDQVKLRMIVLNNTSDPNAPRPGKLAEEIFGKLKEGASFEEMATLYSQGPERAQGGDKGWMERSVLRRELAEVAFALKAGEHSKVIETKEAFYLVKVEEIKPSHYKALGEVRDQIERNLQIQERSRLEKQWMEKLKKKTFVRYF